MSDSQPTDSALCQSQVTGLVRAMQNVCDDEDGSAKTSSDTTIDPDISESVRRLHMLFAAQLSQRWSGILRSQIDIQLNSSIDSQGNAALTHSWWQSTLKPDPLPGNWYLQVQPETCCALVDRMLGGEPEQVDAKPLTSIEQSLMSRLIEEAAEAVRANMAGDH